MNKVEQFLSNLENRLNSSSDKNIKFITGKDADGYERSGICINGDCIILIIKSDLEAFSDLYINIRPLKLEEKKMALFKSFVPSAYEIKILSDKVIITERKLIDLDEEPKLITLNNIEEAEEFLYEKIRDRINTYYDEYYKIFRFI